MKKTSLLIVILFMASFIQISCGDDDITELAWTNGSSESINEIVWASGDAIWVKNGGYTTGDQTESKEVNRLAGEVECTILDGDEFVTATVTIDIVNSSSLSLPEGEANTFTISAEPVTKK